MIKWLESLLGSAGRAVSSPISRLIGWAVGGLTSILELIFGDVTTAWKDAARAARDLEVMTDHFGAGVFSALHRLITFDIPHFAMTAWWWATHPHDLADVLYWHVIYWLEARAWATGRYLGEFLTSLILHNMRRVAHLLEAILAAVL